LSKKIFDKLSNETRFTALSFERAAARGIARRARPSHVCEPSGIFSDVHAAGENDFYFLCACERKLCEAFLPSETFGWAGFLTVRSGRRMPPAFGMHQQGIDRALQGSGIPLPCNGGGIYRAVKIILYFFAVFL